jgi:hypothetical protein
VVGLLNYDIVTIDVPKTIRATKGIVENPFVKIEMTKSNAFLVMTFGEYIDIKWKGRATQLYKPEVAVGKKKRKTLKKSQSSTESEEDEDLEDEDDDKVEDDKEEDKQKQKKQKTGHELYLEYLDTGNFKNTPSKKKRTKSLADDDDDDDDVIELSPGTMKRETMVNRTISPFTVKMEKNGKRNGGSRKRTKTNIGRL